MTGDDNDGIPLSGKLSKYEHSQPCISFTISSSLSSEELVELESRRYNMNQMSRYYQLGNHRDRDLSRPDDFRSLFVQQFEPNGEILLDSLKVAWIFEMFVGEMAIRLPMGLDGEIQLLDDLMLTNCDVHAKIRFINGEVDSVFDRTIESELQLTWQQSEAPPAIWGLRDKAEQFHPDPALIIDDHGRVDRFVIEHPELSASPIIFRRRYSVADESSFIEEVSVAFFIKANQPEHTADVTFDVHADFAPFVFDKLHSHDKMMKKKNNAESDNFSSSTIIPSSPLPSILLVINKQFPAIRINSEYVAVISSCINLNYSSNTKNTTRATRIIIQVNINNLLAQLDYPSNELSLRFNENKNPILTITEFLTAANLQHLLPKFPPSLIENVRLTNCNIRVPNLYCNGLSPIYARASAGKKVSDRLLVMTYVDWKKNNDQQSEEARKVSIVKLHDSKFITNKYFPALINNGIVSANHCFVYFDGDQASKLNQTLNDPVTRCWLKYNDSEFPKTIIPCGSNFLTVKQQKIIIWTPAINNNINDVAVIDKSDEQNKQSSDSSSEADRVIIKFDILTALSHDSRCSSQLAHYLLDFLPINVIYSLFAVLIVFIMLVHYYKITNGGSSD